ncbi:MAG: glutamyl-tRNA reductase [Nocardioidaceae bacterium]|nr:glutamyl-tRNA reductase [Nocardioidaceae bacterium]
MSILCVGISHQSAPVAVLETLAVDAEGAAKLARAVAETEHVAAAVVVCTCNRVEVYAEVDRFHGSVEDVSGLLCDLAAGDRDEVVRHLYVHYDEGALAHLFTVAAGLDSMVVGESQILGQVRAALVRGQHEGTVGPALNAAFQQALRVGKRSHAETNIDRAGPSLVSAALDRVSRQGMSVRGARALVVGAGAMAGLAVAHLARRGAATITVLNRSPAGAQRLAAGVGGRSAELSTLGSQARQADLVVCCTGATGVVVRAVDLAPALTDRTGTRAPGGADPRLAVVDLALPHDVDPAVAADPRVHYTGLAALAGDLASGDSAADITHVRGIVAEEVAAFVGARSAAYATPTVVALRSMATDVVDSELARLWSRLPTADEQVRAELEQTVRRVAGKLLHAPTTRIKELTGQPAGLSYAEVLAELFSLPSGAADAVTRASVDAADPGEVTP